MKAFKVDFCSLKLTQWCKKKNVEDFPRRSAFTFFFTTINQGTISVWEKLCLEHKINKGSILLIQTFAKLCLVIHASNKKA